MRRHLTNECITRASSFASFVDWTANLQLRFRLAVSVAGVEDNPTI